MTCWKGGASLDEKAHEYERLSVGLVRDPKPKQWEPARFESFRCPFDKADAERILVGAGYVLDPGGWEFFPDEGEESGACWQIDLTREER